MDGGAGKVHDSHDFGDSFPGIVQGLDLGGQLGFIYTGSDQEAADFERGYVQVALGFQLIGN